MSSRRRLIADVGAEASLLGALLLSKDAIQSAMVRALVPEDFVGAGHRDAFAAMLTIVRRDEPLDAVTLAAELDRAGVVDDPQALAMTLQASPPSSLNADRYARIVSEHAYRRRVVVLASDLSAAAMNGHEPQQLARLVRDGAAALEARADTDAGAVDLGPIVAALVAGEDPGPWPTMLERTDGQHLVYAGALTLLYGPGGAGKSTLAAYVASERLRAGERVLWLDYEQSAEQVTAMLLRVGADPDAILERFRYYHAIGRTVASYIAIVRRVEPSLVVLDAVIGALGVDGIDENDNGAVGRWIDADLRALTRDRLGLNTTAVMALDHVAAEQPGAGAPKPKPKARGATRKHDAADVTIEAHVLRPWSREQRGTLGLTVWKDRFGSFHRSQRIAELDVTPEDNGATIVLSVAPPSGIAQDGSFRPTVLMERVSRFLELNPGASSRDVDDSANVKGNREHKRTALAVLIDEGFVTAEPDGKSIRHRSITAYREHGEDAV